MDDKKKKKTDDGSALEGASSWWGGLTAEFKRIAWPTRQQVVKMTIATIVISGIIGAIIFLYDLGLNFLFDRLINLVG
ncbi:MAG: preprotein translocase subunit SecE [Defluviitaleaceae bacterium]|nr:preprotein translocase subunit SecE [Defluviitaleaceae bacterium]